MQVLKREAGVHEWRVVLGFGCACVDIWIGACFVHVMVGCSVHTSVTCVALSAINFSFSFFTF